VVNTEKKIKDRILTSQILVALFGIGMPPIVFGNFPGFFPFDSPQFFTFFYIHHSATIATLPLQHLENRIVFGFHLWLTGLSIFGLDEE